MYHWFFISILFLNCNIFLYIVYFSRYHLGDYGGEILNEVKINRSEKELYATPATLHNGNHHKVQECKTKVIIFWGEACMIILTGQLVSEIVLQ